MVRRLIEEQRHGRRRPELSPPHANAGEAAGAFEHVPFPISRVSDNHGPAWLARQSGQALRNLAKNWTAKGAVHEDEQIAVGQVDGARVAVNDRSASLQLRRAIEVLPCRLIQGLVGFNADHAPEPVILRGNQRAALATTEIDERESGRIDPGLADDPAEQRWVRRRILAGMLAKLGQDAGEVLAAHALRRLGPVPSVEAPATEVPATGEEAVDDRRAHGYCIAMALARV